MGQNPTQLILWTVILYRKIKVHFNRLFVRWLDVRSKYLLIAITLGQWRCVVIYLGNLARKKFARKIYRCVYLSHFIITKLFLKAEYLLLSIWKETRPQRPRIYFGNFPSKSCPCKMSICALSLDRYIINL